MNETIEDTTELVVGKYYKVPCAVIVLVNGYNRIGGPIEVAVPIINLNHRDPSFTNGHKHFHIDARFTNLKQDKYYHIKGGLTDCVIWTKPAEMQQALDHYFRRVETRTLKCKRLITGLSNEQIPHSKRYNEWYSEQLGKSCAGRKCPHYGTKMQLINGVLVCPLHNLQGCATTEKIIPYNFSILKQNLQG